MDTISIKRKFSKIGADILFKDYDIRKRAERRGSGFPQNIVIDVKDYKDREFFVIDTFEKPEINIEVLQIRKEYQSLLLMVRDMNLPKYPEKGKPGITKYLCGIDESHWFVAALPEKLKVKTVDEAYEALKPEEIVKLREKNKIRNKNWNKRKNPVYKRQGEWFFIPAPEIRNVDDVFIFHKEPLSRGNGSKPHVCEEVIRSGGIQVFVHWSYAPQGIPMEEYKSYIQDHPDRRGGWRIMRRNPKTYARGQVRHKDHKTLYLDIWHRVIMNRESESWSLRMLTFLD